MTDDTSLDAAESPTEAAPPPAESPPTTEEPAPAPEEPSVAERERDEFRDLLLRKTAEFDNYRKRVDRERQAADQAAAADLITELLPLIDDLERALAAEADSDAAEAYRTGVELIRKQLLDVLARRGVAPLDTAGQQFDPHFHEAVAHEESADHEAGQIIGEVRRGYVMGARLLRPAMVRVAKS
ncbi:MAG: nucleotide exchange factor GrpE [Acidobacteria bacterium]|nr:nucleotide exchange factor GrpE [Acidobacteriota bacterium]MYI74894.1 nucleotide exchange factor GrpE [Acidobacteriota bacterium]